MNILQRQLKQLMQDLQLEDAPAGGSLVVYHKGELVAEANIGEATPDSEWTKDTLSLNFSTGKGVLVTLIHSLVSNELLNYDQPIADYWPEFAANGKQDISLRQVLTHQSGLYNIQSITDSAQDMLDWQLMLQRVEAMSPQNPVNKEAISAYSALVSGWVLGGLIEKVTGMELNQALEKYLAKPLGIEGAIYFGVPEAKLATVATLSKNFDEFSRFTNPDKDIHLNKESFSTERSAKKRSSKPKLRSDSQKTLEVYQSMPSYDCWQQAYNQLHPDKAALNTLDIANLYFDMGSIKMQDYKYALVPAGRSGFDYYTPEALMAKIPAANNVASAVALAKMYAMLANKGVWQGKRIISEAVFEQLSQIQVQGSDAIMPASDPHSMQWRLGYHRVFSHYKNEGNIKSAFGHMGYNGSEAWCDPESELAVAYVHNYDVTMSTDIRQFAINETVLREFG